MKAAELFVLTSNGHAKCLPIEQLVKSTGEMPVLDVSCPSFYIDFDRDTLVFGNADAEVSLGEDLALYYPDSFSLHTLTPNNNFSSAGEKDIAVDTWVNVWEAVEYFSIQHRHSWLNPPYYARIADNKVVFATEKYEVPGMRTLNTKISNCLSSVLDFSAFNGNSVAVKTASRREFISDEKMLATQHFTRDEILLYRDDVSRCPLQYQRFVTAPNQLRVFVFGEAIITFKLTTNHGIINPDVRVAADDAFTISRVSIGSNLEASLVHFVEDMLKIDFVSLDLIIEDDDIYLIDINPNSRWHWLPRAYKDEVDTAFANSVRTRLSNSRD